MVLFAPWFRQRHILIIGSQQHVTLADPFLCMVSEWSNAYYLWFTVQLNPHTWGCLNQTHTSGKHKWNWLWQVSLRHGPFSTPVKINLPSCDPVCTICFLLLIIFIVMFRSIICRNNHITFHVTTIEKIPLIPLILNFEYWILVYFHYP